MLQWFSGSWPLGNFLVTRCILLNSITFFSSERRKCSRRILTVKWILSSKVSSICLCARPTIINVFITLISYVIINFIKLLYFYLINNTVIYIFPQLTSNMFLHWFAIPHVFITNKTVQVLLWNTMINSFLSFIFFTICLFLTNLFSFYSFSFSLYSTFLLFIFIFIVLLFLLIILLSVLIPLTSIPISPASTVLNKNVLQIKSKFFGC